MRSASTVAAWMAARNAVRFAPSQPPRVSTSTLGVFAYWPGRRAAAHPGAAQPRRQRHQVHGCREVRVTAKVVNGHFNVSVTDSGPGIPEEYQTRIFDQFHQVDSSNTKAKGGTGLGLAIAKQIVEMHGGRIWVESTLGNGSTFRMELPTRVEFRKLVP